MQKAIVCKKNVEVSKARNKRPIDIAHSLIPMTKLTNDGGKITTVVFHKSMYGHVLIALNEKNKAVNAWSDVKGIIPIKSHFISNTCKFTTILKSLKPQTLYLNDCELIHSIPNQCMIKPYCNKNLLALLDELHEIEKLQTAQNNTDNKVQTNYNVNKLKNDKSHIDDCNIPSFNDMKIMEPTITRKQYKHFRQNIIKSIL